MTSLSSISFGDFNSLCQTSSFPVCRAFTDITSNCTMQSVSVLGGNTNDVGEFLSSYFVLLGVLTIAYRTHTKYAAVGRLEMGILNLLYILILLTEMSLGVFEPISHSIIGSINGGLIFGFFWVLFLNAILINQFVEDGTSVSLWTTFVSSATFSSGVAYLIYSTIKDKTESNFSVMYILLLVWPAISILLFCIMSTVMVLKQLNQPRSLINLVFALIFMVISITFTFEFNNQICTKSLRFITGSPFGVLFGFFSYLMLHRFWCDITESNYLLI